MRFHAREYLSPVRDVAMRRVYNVLSNQRDVYSLILLMLKTQVYIKSYLKGLKAQHQHINSGYVLGLIMGRRVISCTPEFLGLEFWAAPLNPLHRGLWSALSSPGPCPRTTQPPVGSCLGAPPLPPWSIIERSHCECAPAPLKCPYTGALQAGPLFLEDLEAVPLRGALQKEWSPSLTIPSSLFLLLHWEHCCCGLWAKPVGSALLKLHCYWELQIKSVSVTSH